VPRCQAARWVHGYTGLRVPGHPVCTQPSPNESAWSILSSGARVQTDKYCLHTLHKHKSWELVLKLDLELLCTQKGRLPAIKEAPKWPQVSNRAISDPFTWWPGHAFRCLYSDSCFLCKHCYQNGRERFGAQTCHHLNF